MSSFFILHREACKNNIQCCLVEVQTILLFSSFPKLIRQGPCEIHYSQYSICITECNERKFRYKKTCNSKAPYIWEVLKMLNTHNV